MWAHEHWSHEKAPDIVTFAKKMLIGGYYYSDDMRWNAVRNKNFFRDTRRIYCLISEKFSHVGILLGLGCKNML